MITLKSFMAILIMATLTNVSCKKEEATTTKNLTAEWNSTSIKIDGVASPLTTTIFLHLQASKQFEITTNIFPFTHPKSGNWSVNSAGNKLILAGNEWTIHHIEGSTLRIAFILDGRELEIDFKK